VIRQGVNFNMAAVKLLDVFTNPLFYNDDFLEELKAYGDFDIQRATPFKITSKAHFPEKKLNPLLRVAIPQDAKIIADLVKEVYDGTYPYKEMEDEEEVRRMIVSGKTMFVLFLDKQSQVFGSTAFEFDFGAKRCSMRTWVVKKEYHGKFESTKSLMGCCVYVWSLYRDNIYLWYGEVRTAHAKTQYILDLISLKGVGFYPNKDIFYGNVESDILQISYNKKALKELRCRHNPTFIPEVEKSFIYSNGKFGLGPYQVVIPKISLSDVKIRESQERLIKEIHTDKFEYSTIKLSITGSDSYLEFLYTPTVQNIEKTKYKAENIEELFVLIQEFKNCAEELQVRYFEVFVSAYNASHQQIFLDLGLIPRGYVPSWEYNKEYDCFEDRILFNCCEGTIDTTMVVYEENKPLLETLGFV